VYPLRRLQIIGHKNAIKHKNRGPPISWFHEKFLLKIYLIDKKSKWCASKFSKLIKINFRQLS
jgi:hypothetical protein